VVKAWTDESFKQRLLDDPRTVLIEHGVPLPEGTEVRVVENTERLRHSLLPAMPEGLSVEDLEQLEGGACIQVRCYL
jgi:hypothetical protein